MNPMRILVTGANGQLGQTLREIAAAQKELEFVFLDRNSLPIEQYQTLFNYLSLVHFDFCINAAAYTGVDLAETEQDLSYEINAIAVERLAVACRDHNVKLIHFSTDYVFDGKSHTPYRESDATNPVNFYGFTKRKGEELGQLANPDMIIIRTSWLYSPYGKNFVKTMLRLMKERAQIKVVNDQVGSPTYAFDLATAILTIIRSNQWQAGIYHFSNLGAVSWFEFASAISTYSKIECEVKPIPTTEFPTPAKRPAFSVLDCRKIEEKYRITQFPWKERLRDCLKVLGVVEK